MLARNLASFVPLLLVLSACGGSERERLPDESGDEATSGGMAARVVEMPEGLDGTEWRWVEAHCTEGPLDLLARGYASRLRIAQDGESILLTSDQQFATERCVQTVVQRVSPPPTPGELRVEEIARVAVPSTPECFGQPEQPRPGEVRRDGRRLEVLIQRSNWCGGFEVRMVYEAAMPQLLTNEEIVRRWAAAFSLGDADRIATLFAPTASLLERFTITETGDPYRHDGRDAVRGWFQAALASSDWRAVRITAIENGEQPHTVLAAWEYMDSRLAAPVPGRIRFTIAAGEIFEADIQLDGDPVLTPPAE